MNRTFSQPFYLFLFLCLVLAIGFAGTTSVETPPRKNQTWLQQHREAAKTTVLLNNQQGLVPVKDLEQQIASVTIGAAHAAVFDSLLNKYTAVSSFSAPAVLTDSSLNSLNDDLKFYKTVLVQLPAAQLQQQKVVGFLQDLQKDKQLVVAVYGKPALLANAETLTAPLIWSEKETASTADFVAQLIFGGVAATAELDKTYSAKYAKGAGHKTQAIRLKYTVPEEVGISTNDLQRPIDSIAAEMIREQAAPGAVVLVAKDGKVIFNKAYGSHTYDKSRPTRITDIFDLASVTKVSATTMAVMELYEQQKVSLDAPFSTFIPSAEGTSKANISLRDILLHQAGLPAGVGLPLRAEDQRRTPAPGYSIKAGDSTFMRDTYFKEVVWPRMLSAKMGTAGQYIYSDLTMYFLKEVVERQTLTPLNELVQSNLYHPLGMQTAGFLPLSRFEKSRIVPTEVDHGFRKELLQGYVHDGGAARLGGVSGHAGLFSTANDLAILYQMMLNRGTYGGVQYFQPETVQLFTSKQSAVSRRGLGFDRWDPDTTKGYPSKLASPQTYGHTGYTGTCVWVDPRHNLVYVFLSNRVHPKVSNKLLSLNIRPRIQDAIYKAIEKGATAGKNAGAKPAQP
ncbi:serine hydrolase domain-containing protein [Rufibacter ruber]|uniref:serine hydrolase domain-containing protein n=1 Tax=Rufibacter ruber TaxID=1783499 RepID=UPI000833335B|nr:serine hydrolase [Rufibacter ruber]